MTLWYCSTRPRGRRANASVIGDGSAKWKIVMSPRRRRGIGERPDVAPQVVVDRQRVDVGVVAHRAQQRRASRRALSPMASPLWAAGTHWLTITPALLGQRHE